MGFLLFLAEEDEAEETKSLMKRREKKRAEKHTRKYGWNTRCIREQLSKWRTQGPQSAIHSTQEPLDHNSKKENKL